MPRLRDRLPPPNSIVVFEAVARHLSFTAAARELRVSQAAVSRQVQILEAHFGLALFQRLHRRVEPTPQGAALAKAVSAGLENIAGAADEVRRQHQAEQASDITVSSSVTFASYWLMSRIAKFRAQFPEVDIRLVASAKTASLGSADIDLAVRYGRGDWSGVNADFMFGNEVLPVCAPRYLEDHGALNDVADLGRTQLLHLAHYDRNWVTWETWLRAFGVERADRPDQPKGLLFDNYMLLIHAAVRGEGVALCGGRLAEDLIARGELVRPIREWLPSELSFYLLSSADRQLRPDAARFRIWLLDEARAA